jgi:hypothetical protein
MLQAVLKLNKPTFNLKQRGMGPEQKFSLLMTGYKACIKMPP